MIGDFAPEELLNEAQWRRWSSDPIAFFAEAVTIQHPSRGRVPFVLRDAQRETLQAFVESDRVIILKARQIGFSTLVANYALWLALFREDQQIILLSKTEREAVELLTKAKYAFSGLPEWVRARAPRLTNDHQLKMIFNNNSVVESLPSKQDPARGRSVSLVIVDEWAFFENPEAAWASIEPITDIGGRVIALSTANGAGTFYHDMWVRARAGTNGFRPVFFPWSAVPERDENWYETKRQSMLQWQLWQEYPSNEEECFIRSGNPVFDLDMLREFESSVPDSGYLAPASQYGHTYEFRATTAGPLYVWKFPQSDHGYVIGADTSEGLVHGDYSCAQVIDQATGEVVAVWHGHIDPDLFGTELERLGYWYNRALIGPEANNHGLTTCKTLQKAGYPRIYYRRTVDTRTTHQTERVGWWTSRVTKPLMIDELNSALREGSLRVFDEHTLAELRTFVRDDDGSMHGSPLDDRTMALAIANQMRKWAVAPEYKLQSDDPTGTWDWWAKMVDEPSAPQPIGSHATRRSPWGGFPGW